MKTKPTKHKEENTFKFQTFSERLANVNIDVIHQIRGNRSLLPDETETFFYETLEKWTDLNCTEGYTKFCRELGREVVSLAQLLHSKERIIDHIVEHLTVDNLIYAQPLLELIVAIARDLQSDFYPYFPRVFKKIVGLSDCKNPELLEWTFSCLAFLYKTLWRYLVRDVTQVYELQLHLLGSDKPDYIRLFAAESFAFLGRKVSDKAAFIDFVFSHLDSLRVEGTAQLLFQLARGVQQQFHSSHSVFLPLFLEPLKKIEQDFETDPIYQAVCGAFELMAGFTTAAFAATVWKILVDEVSSTASGQKGAILSILQFWVSFRNGGLVADSLALIQALIPLMDNEASSKEHSLLADIAAGLIISTKVKLPIEHTALLLSKLYSTDVFPTEVVLEFSSKLFDHHLFESHILPRYLQFCHSVLVASTKSGVLKSLAGLVLKKSPLPTIGSELSQHKTYSLEFTFAMRKVDKKQNVPDMISEILGGDPLEAADSREVFEDMVCALLCLHHVKPLDKTSVEKKLKNIAEGVLNILSTLQVGTKLKKARTFQSEREVLVERLEFLLNAVVFNLCWLTSANIGEVLGWEQVESLFERSEGIYALRSLDFYLTTLKENDLSQPIIDKVFPVLEKKLMSPFHQVRLLALHVLSLFDLPMAHPPENVNPRPLFQLCFEAEQVPIGIREQRVKLKCLQMLEADSVKYSLPLDERFRGVPVQYLLSQLYINFRPLWEPVLDYIASHASEMDSERFWALYHSFVEHVRDFEEVDSKISLPLTEDLRWQLNTERYDWINVRCLLWQVLAKIPALAEKKHSVVVPMFVEFWNKEYCQSDKNVASVQDLTVRSASSGDTDKSQRRGLVKLLCAHLSVFAKFKRPRYMKNEPQVTSILYEASSHRQADVQKTALECLFAYGYPYLNTYKDNLARILDDKTVRSELTLFGIDAEKQLVRPEHREGLMPVLLRLLYGKMNSKTGPNSSGKQHTQNRQSLVLRYLAGSSEKELKVFLDLAFHLFEDYMKEDPLHERVQSILTTTAPSRAWPLKRLQAALNLLGNLFSKLGNLMKTTLPVLLSLLLCMGAHVTALIEKRDAVDTRHVELLKNLRSLVQQKCIQFFEKFEFYPWSADEVEALFDVAVWPQLSLLPVEAIHSPTPLVKLIQTWAENPRYHILLAKVHRQDSSLTVMKPLLTLLSEGKAHNSVNSAILEVVEKLLTLSDYGTPGMDNGDDEEELPMEPVYIKPNFVLDLDAELGTVYREKPNMGTCLIIPHIDLVLAYFERVLKRGLAQRDLIIMSRLSEFVVDARVSGNLIKLIIPTVKTIAAKKILSPSNEESLVHHLASVCNLLSAAENPQQFLSTTAALFSSMTSRILKEALCNVLEAIGKRNPEVKGLCRLVCSLNAWDHRRADQPDFSARLAAFKEINKVLESGEASPDWLLLVLYNCFGFVRTEEDMSLRDSSSFSLQLMAQFFGQHPDQKLVLNNHFVPQVRQLLRSKSERVRHEGVSILSQTVIHCQPLNSSMRDLAQLRCEEDSEVDFFENSKHLQTHRRSRALTRLASMLKENPQLMNIDTLSQFLLPLATCYLFQESYIKHTHLIDAALECLQAISRTLPWFSYEKLLRFYLTNLTRQVDYQKQAVRAVVAVLDSFHFDLRQAPVVESSATKERVEEETDVNAAPLDTIPEIGEDSEALSAPAAAAAATLSSEVSSKIVKAITEQLLPSIHRLLTARSKRDAQHKLNKDYYPEDEEILRVPLALAVVSLLKNLPAGTLERNLPGIFSKVGTFLKSRADSIRGTARDTLVRMMVALGPSHLPTLLSALHAILQRGFQVHVLMYTVHAILVKLEENQLLSGGSLDRAIGSLTEICKKDLFGAVAEEKEVTQIVAKVKEARGTKTYDTYHIVSKYASQSTLLTLILPLKEALSTRSLKTVRKVEECFHNIAAGLALNKSVATEQLIIFLYGIVSMSIDSLAVGVRRETSGGQKASAGAAKPDSFLIAPEPKRKSAAQPSTPTIGSGVAYKTNSHVVVEFGLHALNLLLKRERCHERKNEVGHLLPMLDPFVQIIVDSLQSPHAKMVSMGLRCLCRLLPLPLPALTENAKKVATAIFVLLRKYAGAGSTSGDITEMVQIAFKAVTVFVRDITHYTIDTDELRVLLTYAEQALDNVDQQATGFNILRTVLGRKLTLKELPEVMNRIAKMSIVSEIDHVRDQCRQVVLTYLVEYPLGRKLELHLEFYLSQLQYERESGRLSAIELLSSVFSTFPKDLLTRHRSLFFISLSPRLLNDPSPACAKAVAEALKTLLRRLDTNLRSELFEICMTWLQDSNLIHRRLAAQLTGIFAETEGAGFGFRLRNLLPAVNTLLHPSVYEGVVEDKNSDHLLIQLLCALTKICQHCGGEARNADLLGPTEELWEHVVTHLLHPHSWVRTLGARLVGIMLGWHSPDGIAQYFFKSQESRETFLLCPNGAERLRTISANSIQQLQSPLLDDSLAEQVVKNLVFVAKVANRAPESKGEDEIKLPTMSWIISRLRREVHVEVAKNPKGSLIRTSAFKWIAAVAVDLHEVGGSEKLIAALPSFVPPVTREIADEGSPAEVRELAQEVADLLRGLAGTEAFVEVAAASQRKLSERRNARHRERKAVAVVKPEVAARSRIKKHEAKKEAKKRKIAHQKGAKMKKPKLRDLVIASDI